MAHSFFVVVPDYDQILSYRYNPGDTFQPIISELADRGYPTRLIYYNGIQSFPLEPDREIIDCFPERRSQVLIFAMDDDYVFPTVESSPNDILIMILKDNLRDVILYSLPEKVPVPEDIKKDRRGLVSYVMSHNTKVDDMLTDLGISNSQLKIRLGLAEPGWYFLNKRPLRRILYERRDQILFQLGEPKREVIMPDATDTRILDMLEDSLVDEDFEVTNAIFDKYSHRLIRKENLEKLEQIVFYKGVDVGMISIADIVLDNFLIRNDERALNDVIFEVLTLLLLEAGDTVDIDYLLNRSKFNKRYLMRLITRVENMPETDSDFELSKAEKINLLKEYGYEHSLLERPKVKVKRVVRPSKRVRSKFEPPVTPSVRDVWRRSRFQ